ncbi:MAG: magnesium transporter [Candidatus Hadarchaeales archaeon]
MRFWRTVAETYLAVVICAFISLFSGLLAEHSLSLFYTFPFLLVMVPPINDIAGNVGTILGARLSSALHLGTIAPRQKGELYFNMKIVSVSSLLMYAVVSLVFFLYLMVAGGSGRLALVMLFSGLILTPMVVLSSTLLSLLSFAKGLDPDNITGPLITSLCDVLGMCSLLLSARLLL